MPRFDSGVIIGAGVVGLAIAAELSRSRLFDELWVIEREAGFGYGTSSRNSEVIHAGLYYPPGSLKARLCVEGRERLYTLCRAHDIPHRQIGKLVIAISEAERTSLEQVHRNAAACGVRLEELSPAAARGLEPHVRFQTALFSPLTGIIGSHALMQWFYREALAQQAQVVFNTTVTAIESRRDGYLLHTRTPDAETFSVRADVVVNAAGLHADTIAGLAGCEYRLHWCKGLYFSVAQSKARLCSHLIYTAVPRDAPGLGMHVGFDLSGRMKLGPDATYVGRSEDYAVAPERLPSFYEAAARFLPFIERDDLQPEMAGIRAKLQGEGEPFADFVIRQDRPGLINCVGIDSPGLTASPAIAAYVRDLLS